MPVSKDQAEMLANLAVAMRPTGASRWDAPGVVAAIGKVKHLQLSDVVMAVARAADDREAQTPGVIGNVKSPCWRERPLRPEYPETFDPAENCAVCSLPQSRCQSAAMPDHEFITAAAHAAQVAARGYDTAAIVTDIKGSKEPMRPRRDAEPVESDEELAARVAALKAQLGHHDKGDAA